MAHLMTTHVEPESDTVVELDPPKGGYKPVQVDSHSDGKVTVIWEHQPATRVQLPGWLEEAAERLVALVSPGNEGGD